MDFNHIPVLFEECIDNLNIIPDGIYADGTLGGGGHALGIGRRLSGEGTLIGIDRDAEAISAAEKNLLDLKCEVRLVHGEFADIKEILKSLGISGINGAILDIGVSSYQLDNGERGFSYMHDAPLDMRMNRDDGFSAFNVVNEYSRKELSGIISKYGEEKWASRISDFIVKKKKGKSDRNHGGTGRCNKSCDTGVGKEKRTTSG